MPLFDFKCECGFSTEELVKNSSDTIKCEKCGKEIQRDQNFKSAGFKLKGSGWFDSKGGYANTSQAEFDRELEKNRRLHDMTEKSVVEGIRE